MSAWSPAVRLSRRAARGRGLAASPAQCSRVATATRVSGLQGAEQCVSNHEGRGWRLGNARGLTSRAEAAEVAAASCCLVRRRTEPTATTALRAAGCASRRPTQEMMSLQDFLHRSKVLNQYRAFTRTLGALERAVTDTPTEARGRRGVSSHYVAEVRAEVRTAFRRAAGEGDPAERRRLLLEGERQLAVLTSNAYARGARVMMPQGGQGGDGGHGDEPDEPVVGQGWPWERE